MEGFSKELHVVDHRAHKPTDSEYGSDNYDHQGDSLSNPYYALCIEKYKVRLKLKCLDFRVNGLVWTLNSLYFFFVSVTNREPANSRKQDYLQLHEFSWSLGFAKVEKANFVKIKPRYSTEISRLNELNFTKISLICIKNHPFKYNNSSLGATILKE